MRKFMLVSLAITFAAVCSLCAAQVDTGQYPFGTFDNKGLDTINVGNLNVHFSLPVLNKAGRGLSFYYDLGYDSSIWTPALISGNKTWTPVLNWGWTAETDAQTGYLSDSVILASSCLYQGHHVIYEVWGDYSYHDVLGVVHDFPGVKTTNNPTCAGIPVADSGTAADSSGYTITVGEGPTTVTSRTGTVTLPPTLTFSGAGSTTDSNGNTISVNSSGQVTDTTGNIVLTMAGSAPSPTTYTYTDTTGTSRQVTVNYSTYTVQTAFGCSGVSEFGPSTEYLVSSITYPDGSSYSFTYEATPGHSGNVTGRLASVTTPQGGVISYAYSGEYNGIECADGSSAGLTRSLSSTQGSAASTWTYTRTTGSGTSETTVTDGLSNQSTYNFVEASNQQSDVTAVYYEAARSVYQGSTSGTLLLSRQTCYNAEAQPCTTSQFSLPITQIGIYETLNGSQERGSTAIYNAYGLQTEEDDYDFGGASQRGSLLRKEVWTYPTSGIPNLLQEDDVYDGNGTISSLTSYGYDQTTPVASSGVPQHLAESGPRGNLTSITNWLGKGVTYTTTYTYEDTGSVLTYVSPTTTSGATTTYSYDPTFVYNIGVQLPTPSSGVALSSTQTYDQSYTGLPKTSTDPNTQPTNVESYDSMLRPTEVDFPDGGKTTTSYSPTQVGIHRTMSSSASTDTEMLYDEYGRLSRTAVYNGNANNGLDWYQQDACYDADGRISFESYRYQSSGFAAPKVCSGAGDIYSYDALGRLTNIAHQDGTSVQYRYLGRDTKITDENQISRTVQADGLGRTAAVCEMSSTNYQGDTPAACNLDIAGNGFLTTYAYVADQTTVTQGAQMRVFQTDMLGRPTSVHEPESGTTTYTYSINSTGPIVTRVRPSANQTNPALTTTTTTQYDALGRVLSITYSDGTAPKYYGYDSGPNWGVTFYYQKGRLAWYGNANGGGSVQGEIGYDPMGRVNLMDQCDPSNCGKGAYTTSYTYDFAGDIATSTDGAGVKATYTYSPAAELDQLTSSLSDATHPGTLVSSVQNGPDGPLSWQLGNGLYGVRSYDSLGRNNGGWVCSGSAQGYCNGGSQTYGYTVGWSGTRVTGICDTALNRCSSYGYDDLNHLASQTVTSGPPDNFTYLYDRYGNRWQQNVTAGSGPAPSFSFNKSTNQITSSGYTYDAAGNLMSDGSHTYTYDADGNVTQVDGGAMKYTYNVFNQRVRIDQNGSDSQEIVFNLNGQRVSIWDPQAGWEDQGQNYWGAVPVEFYQDGYGQFQHQDYSGTERMRTSYNGGVDGTFTSLPFGDGYTYTGNDHDAYHFAELDHDASSDTDHAQFRQYANVSGNWMSPDPNSGSYDINNPQSMNRYSYVLNSPLSLIDPSGLDEQTDNSSNDTGCGIACQMFAAMGAGYGTSGGWSSWAGPVTPWDYAYGFAPGYSLDGQEISNRLAGSLAQSGAAMLWVPNFIFAYVSMTDNYTINGSQSSQAWQQTGGYVMVGDGNWVEFTPADLYAGLPQVARSGGGGGGGVHDYSHYCSVLSSNCTRSLPARLAGFYGCEYNSIIQTITNEEDGTGWTAYGFMNAGAIAAIKYRVYNPIGVTFVASAAAMDIGAEEKANVDCSEAYGF